MLFPRSFTLRLTLSYVLLFGLSMLLLLGFIYWSSVDYMRRESDAVIQAEVDGLAERYEVGGLFGLMQLIEERVRREPRDRSLYLLTRPDYQVLQGNMPRWPQGAADREGWIDFSVAADDGAASLRARGRHFTLPGGTHLLVGRDIEPLLRREARMREVLAWGLGLALFLGVVGGAFLSRRVTHRIETVNRTTRDIMRGDLSRRVPLKGTDDELDRLAANLNRMLDRIESLMEDVRRVSDNIAHDLRTPLGSAPSFLGETRSRSRTRGVRVRSDDTRCR